MISRNFALSVPAATATLAAGLLLLVSPAAAQPIVQPDGTLADPAAPPTRQPTEDGVEGEGTGTGSGGPTIIQIGPDGKPTLQPQGGEDASGGGGFYYREDQGLVPDDDRGVRNRYPIAQNGPVPELHVVRHGDTLWDICWFYFNNPWEWPRIWSYNPQITNPHWIYPGDQVRLYAVGTRPTEERPVEEGTDQPERTQMRPRGWFSLRQLAFVDRENLEYAALVDGSTDEKLLLTSGDTVYLSYEGKRPPQVGKRYAVYKPTKEVKHPDGGGVVGAYVEVIGEVEVRSVKKGKRARAIVIDAVDPIERGLKVGPLQRQFKDVQPTPSQVDLQGTIIAILFREFLIGARQVVFLDKGTRDGLRLGNRMYVVRRGDMYPKQGEGVASNRGLDDRRYPAHAIGEVLVVQAGKSTSVGLVSLSMQEIEIGDMVLMRRGSGAAEDGEPPAEQGGDARGQDTGD